MRIDTQQGRPVLARRIDGTLEAVRSHLIAVEEAATKQDIDDSRRTDMLMVLCEVLNNIVEHALPRCGEGWIDCEVCVAEHGLSIETRDNGAPLPPAFLSPATLPDIDTEVDTLPEGGWGWFIVHSLTDEMTYDRRNGVNRLRFSLKPLLAPDRRTPRSVSAR